MFQQQSCGVLQDEAQNKRTQPLKLGVWPRPPANAPPPPICPRVPLKRFSRMQGLPTDTDGNMATEVKRARLCLCLSCRDFRNGSVNGGNIWTAAASPSVASSVNMPTLSPRLGRFTGVFMSDMKITSSLALLAGMEV